MPTNISEVYVSFSLWHDSNFEWNAISNKMLYWENGNLIVQSRHNTGDYLSFYNGSGGGQSYEPNQGPRPTMGDFNGKWVNVEVQIKRGTSGFFKIWLNGVLVSNHSVSLQSIQGESYLRLDSTWGGSTGPRTRDSHRRVGHILIATP